MPCGTQRYKIPESVLVVIHTPNLEVLLIRRADAGEHWQSVTGSKETPDEPLAHAAAREVQEETGMDCREGAALAGALRPWGLSNVYDIYPAWAHRYAPGVKRNTEHLFSLCVPSKMPVRLNPREHTAHRWLPHLAAADLCFSPSNAEAILMLPQFVP